MKLSLFGHDLTIERVSAVLMAYNGVLACVFFMGFHMLGLALLVLGALLLLVSVLHVQPLSR